MSETFSTASASLGIAFNRLVREILADLPFRQFITKVDPVEEAKLNQLLTAFEDAWFALSGNMRSFLPKPDPDRYALWFDDYQRDYRPVTYDGSKFLEDNPEIKKLLSAAKLYTVARDQGLTAATLWKLQQE